MKKWNYKFDVPDSKKVRMIVHTDCKSNADELFALAHHLMTPKFIVKGIVGGYSNYSLQEFRESNAAKASVDEINKILSLMGVLAGCRVAEGSACPLKDEETPQPSEGAELIIEEAMKEDVHPLYVAAQGNLTDIASAVLMKPEIMSRMTVIWIGGAQYPEGGFEFNLMQDIAAANVLMKSDVELWQIPMNVYKQMAVSFAELQEKVMPCGEIGNYLFWQVVESNEKMASIPRWPHGEIWGLGDSSAIGVLMEESEKTDVFDMMRAPTIAYKTMKYFFGNNNRPIRVYNQVNARLTIEDFFAKLAINYPPERT